MNASLTEHKLGGLRWIVLNGPDREAFRALGEHVRGEMAALTDRRERSTRPSTTCGRIQRRAVSPTRPETRRAASSASRPPLAATLSWMPDPGRARCCGTLTVRLASRR